MVSEHAESAKSDSILAELRNRLRVLYRHNGEPSTREIARRTGKAISHTTANVVLRCEKIPRWGQLEQVVEALGGDTDEFRQLWIAVRNAADQAEATMVGPSPDHTLRNLTSLLMHLSKPLMPTAYGLRHQKRRGRVTRSGRSFEWLKRCLRPESLASRERFAKLSMLSSVRWSASTRSMPRDASVRGWCSSLLALWV